MNTFGKILFSLSLLSTSLSAVNIISETFTDTDCGWNSETLARMYFHHSEAQRQWAWESLSNISFSGNEKILDFGCRDGKITAEMARLAKNGTVLGVDVSENMIHVAQTYFPQFAFPNLEFQNTQSLSLEDLPGSQDCDLVCAFAVFHLIPTPLETLKNLKSHLKPSGKLLIITPTGENTALYQAADEIFPKYGLETPWSKKKPSGPSMRKVTGCEALLKQAGFHIDSLKVIDTDNAFYDLDDLISWMMGTASATWQIPLHISREFFTDIVHRMYELDPTMIDEDGRCHFKMPRIHATATLNN